MKKYTAIIFACVSICISSLSQNLDNANIWYGSSTAIGQRYVVTNYHVIENARRIIVADANMETSYSCAVVAADKYNDLAILKITDSNFAGFNIKYGCKTRTSDIGTSIYVLGYPMIETMGNDIKLTTGVISSKSGYQGDVSQYQISAAIQPGNSGGPLFDENGYLIGIVSAKHTDAENVGYAVKLSYLQNLIESTDVNITLPTTNSISTYNLAGQVKAVSSCVLMVIASSSYEVPNSHSNSYSQPKSLTQRKIQAEKLLESASLKFENEDFLGSFEDICASVDLYPTAEAHYLRGIYAVTFATLAAMLGYDDDDDLSEAFDAAKESFKYCINDNYETESCSYWYGWILQNYDEDINSAINLYSRALRINAKNIKALNNRGECYYNINQFRLAIADFKSAIKYEGLVEDVDTEYFVKIYNSLAYACLADNEISNAEYYISEALKRAPMDGNIYDSCGEIKYNAGKYRECIASMNNAVAISNGEESSYLYNTFYFRGLAYIKLGYIADGYRDLCKSRDLGNTVDWDKINLSNINYNITLHYSRFYKSPKTKNNCSLKILAVEATDEKTVIYVGYTNSKYNAGGWYNIRSTTYLTDTSGNKYRLLAVENCAISPEKTDIAYGETAKFQLIFEAIPRDCRKIDFIEPGDSDWKIYGIQLVNEF